MKYFTVFIDIFIREVYMLMFLKSNHVCCHLMVIGTNLTINFDFQFINEKGFLPKRGYTVYRCETGRFSSYKVFFKKRM